MAVVLNPDVEPAVNATVSVTAPIEVTFPSSQEISISAPDDTIAISDGVHTAAVTASSALKTDSSATTQPISAASLPLPAGASTATKQDTGNTSLASIDSKLNSPIAVTGPLTDIQLRASPVPISGTVTSTPSGTQDVNLVSSVEIEIKNDTGNPVPVSVTSLPLPTGAATAANQTTANASLASIDSKLTSPVAVTGPLTDTQLRATPVPISGTITATPTGTQDVNVVSSVEVEVKNDTGNPIPVSGTVTANAGTGTFLVDGSAHTQPVSASSLPLPTGAATAALQTQPGVDIGDVTINNASGASAVNIQDGGNSITIDGAVTANAGTNLNTSLLALDSTVAKDASLTTLNTSVNTLLKPANTLTAVTTVGTITNVVHVDDNAGSLTVDNAGTFPVQATLSAETTKVIGTVNQGTSPWVTSGTSTVSGTVAATQSGTWTVQPGNTANTTAWKVDGSAVTQPVSAASLPLPTGAATAALQTTGNTSLSSIDSKLTSPIAVSQSGTWTVSSVPSSSTKATYSAAATFTAVATPTDVFTITGSGTKTIKVSEIGINGTNTGNTNILINLIKRSSANSAGTPTTATAVPLDSSDAAATAVVRSYTTNPTLGTTVGSIRVDYAFFPTLASTNAGTSIAHDFGVDNDKAPTLRGTSEVLAVNLSGVLITGTTSLSIDITWTEE